MPPPSPSGATPAAHVRWFTEHVHPHEPALRAWLHRRFSGRNDVDDIVQETFVRILALPEVDFIDTPRAFLFTTARNIALDRVRYDQGAGASVGAELDLDTVRDEKVDVSNEVARRQELELLTRAVQSLPERCRQVFTLRKLYGLPQREVAARLGISEHTVEAQGSIALRKIEEFFERLDRRASLP